MKKYLANNFFVGIIPALLACVLAAIVVLFPARIQLQKDFVAVNVAYGLFDLDSGLCRKGFDLHGCTEADLSIGCTINNPQLCSNNDHVVLKAISLCKNRGTNTNSVIGVLSVMWNGGTLYCSKTAKDQADKAAKTLALTNPSCEGLENFWAKPGVCTARLVAVGLGGLLISIGAWLLALADMIFNWTVDNTILLFSTALFNKVSPAINIGWTAMRDIANIVIIGMFTFIAVSTILGIKEYGAEKMIARVLVVAVLINFSLLFTKIIVDASNFTAAQFYAPLNGYPSLSVARAEAERLSKGSPGRAVFSTAEDSLEALNQLPSKGIAGQFIGFLKVTSISSTFKSLNTVAEKNSGGGWTVLGLGILGFTLLGGVAVVLFYGAYLLISRAVLFIFLMVTAAGAFATHLIPKMNESKYGWNGWWSSLLHNAALAPLLMFFLWITLQVSQAIQANSGSLGDLVSKDASSADINMLFSYCIILGLLWGSFALAKEWAGQVGGLGFTGSWLSMALAAPLALGSRFIAAPIARKVLGSGAAARSMMLESDLKKEAGKASRIKDKTGSEYKAALDKVTGLMKAKERADKFAHGSFNAANLAPVKAGMGYLGVPGFLTGAGKTEGFADAAKARADAAIKAAEGLVIKATDIGREELAAIRGKLDNDPGRHEDLRLKKQSARDLRRLADSAQATQEMQVQDMNNRLDKARDGKAQGEGTLASVNRQREVEVPVLVKFRTDQANAEATLRQETANQTGTYAEQTARIKAAQEKATIVGKMVEAQQSKVEGLNLQAQEASTAVTNSTQTISETAAAIAGIKRDVADKVAAAEQAEKGAVTALNEATQDEVQEIIDNSLSLATDAAVSKVYNRITNLAVDDTMSNMTRKIAGKHFDKQGYRVRQRIREEKAALQGLADTVAANTAAQQQGGATNTGGNA